MTSVEAEAINIVDMLFQVIKFGVGLFIFIAITVTMIRAGNTLLEVRALRKEVFNLRKKEEK